MIVGVGGDYSSPRKICLEVLETSHPLFFSFLFQRRENKIKIKKTTRKKENPITYIRLQRIFLGLWERD